MNEFMEQMKGALQEMKVARNVLQQEEVKLLKEELTLKDKSFDSLMKSYEKEIVNLKEALKGRGEFEEVVYNLEKIFSNRESEERVLNDEKTMFEKINLSIKNISDKDVDSFLKIKQAVEKFFEESWKVADKEKDVLSEFIMGLSKENVELKASFSEDIGRIIEETNKKMKVFEERCYGKMQDTVRELENSKEREVLQGQQVESMKREIEYLTQNNLLLIKNYGKLEENIL
mmetsp:Transcript_18732/g.19397  ORF Transcript_18732/g.19397 Transcript_18732/m.19397 type:complete len:231 (+) Transcript_18732:1-693(+)